MKASTASNRRLTPGESSLMIICADCKHGAGQATCQSYYAIGLTDEQKKTRYSTCAFYESIETRETFGNEVNHAQEPELF
jgi:hypothetical protein